jgi:hypothetical protein
MSLSFRILEYFYGEYNDLCSIREISNNIAHCEYDDSLLPPFQLSLEEVSTLIAAFLRSSHRNQ